MEMLEVYKKKLIKSINNFPIGDKPQNTKELSAKIAIISHMLANFNFYDECNNISEVLYKMNDKNARELFIRQMIAFAYGLDENNFPTLFVAINYMGINIEYLNNCINFKCCKEYKSKYIETFERLNQYIELAYELKQKRNFI